MSPITTHILDLDSGLPASGVVVTLARQDAEVWKDLATGTSDSDGRIKDLLAPGSLAPGHFRLTFGIGDYFLRNRKSTFYRSVPVEFFIETVDRHFHVPLLISPFGYSTYRGS